MWSELEAELARRKLDERMIDALYEAALGFKVRSARYRVAAEISNQVAAKDLRALVQQGVLIPKGERRGGHMRQLRRWLPSEMAPESRGYR